MRIILEMLKKGDNGFPALFKECDDLWVEIFAQEKGNSIEDLAKTLSTKQLVFERIMGDVYLGKVVMGWSGFTHIYSCDTGFEDNGPIAYRLYQAFTKSMCSMEVKSSVQEAYEAYGVSDYA